MLDEESCSPVMEIFGTLLSRSGRKFYSGLSDILGNLQLFQLPDLVNINMRRPVKFEFQINMLYLGHTCS